MRQFIKKYLWATVGVIVTSVLIPAIFIRYNLFTPKPELKIYLAKTYDELAITEERIDSLSINYKGKDIIKDSLNLVLVKIRIANKGRACIKPDDYTRPLGLIISNCKIIDVQVDKKYFLSNTLKPQIINDSTIHLENIPFDCEDQAKFSVYLLYKWNETPLYTPLGKISGAKENKIPVLLEGEDDPVLTHDDKIALAMIFGSEGIIFLFIVFLVRQYRKWKIIQKLNPHGIIDLNHAQKQFIVLYKKLGKKDFLKLIKGLAKGSDYLRNEEEFISAFKKVNETRKGILFFITKLKYISPFTRSLKVLIDTKLLSEENGQFIMSEELKVGAQETLDCFVSPRI